VLILDLIEHLHPWQVARLLAEIRRITKPNGYVIIHTLPNRLALDYGYPLLRRLVPGLPARTRSSYEQVVHVNEQSPGGLRRCLARAGFEARLWVEEWTTRHARNGKERDYPDSIRGEAYPILGRPAFRSLGRLLMRTPISEFAGNDIFAVASPAGSPSANPPPKGRYRPLA
jgi:SAM-dependent methyltransferase